MFSNLIRRFFVDDVTLNPGSGGATIATDDLGGVHHQKVKIEYGDDGSAIMVSPANPLPVVQDGVATEATLSTISGQLATLSTISGQLGATLSVEGSVFAEQLGVWDISTILNPLPAGNNNIGDVDVATLPPLPAGTNNIGDVDVLSLPAIPTGDNAIGRVKITDGTDVADILDLTNSNPLTVAIVDTNGDQIASFGGGTQYTEDAAAAANPVGTAVNLVRQDTPAGLTTNDGDNVAQRGTNFGAAFVQVLNSSGSFVDTFGGGQQYSDGDAEADPTGTVAMGTDGSNVFALHTDTSGDLQVDVLSSALPSGAATSALQTTGNTSLATIAGAVSGTEMQVDVLTSALPTGASTLTEQQTQTTHLATIAGDTTDIEAAVELIDDTVATLGTTTYTETTTKGLVAGAVRRDADTSAVNTDNEIAPLLVNAIGALKVEVFSGETLPVSVSGVATAANQATEITSLQLIDDTVVTMGTDTYTEATSKGLNITAVRRDADTTLVGTTNEFGPLQMDANGRLKVEVFSGETLPVSLTSTTITGTVAVTDNSGSLTVDAPVGTPVNVQIGNATLSVGVIDETGASAVDALAIGGGTAHDAVDSGNPVKIGAVAVSGSASPTSVASGDRTRLIANQHGIPYFMGGHPNLITREYDFGTAAQTDVNLAAATVAADERVYVTRLEVLCDNANSVAVSARVGFGTASVPAASSSGVSGMIASHPGIAAGSGIICGNGSGIIAVGGAGEEPRITTSAATSGNTHVIISYYVIDETP